MHFRTFCQPEYWSVHSNSSSSITWLCTVLQSGSDYGPYLANEASPLHTTTIVERCTEKLVDDWNRMRANVSVSAFPSAVSDSLL